MHQAIPILLLFYVGLTMYACVPALPYLSLELETTDFAIKASVAVLMFFYGFFKSIWVALSAALSDKVILVIAILASLFGIGITMLSNTIYTYTTGRIIEAIGISGTLIIGRSSLHKNLATDTYSKFISNAVMFIFAACLIGPIVGAYIFKDLGWRYIFGLLLVFNLFINVFVAISYLGIKNEHFLSSSFTKISADFYRLFGKRQLMGYLLPCTITLAGCYSYFVITSYLFMTYIDYKVTTFAYLNIPVVAAFIIGDIFNKIFIKMWSYYKMMVIAFCILLISSISFFFFTGVVQYKTLAILLPVSIFMFATGIICPCSMTRAKDESKDHNVEAAAFFPFLIFVVSAIVTFVLARIDLFAPFQANLFFISLSVLAAAFFFILARPGPKVPETQNNAQQSENNQ